MDQIDRGVLSASCPTSACRDERAHIWPVRQRLNRYRIALITFYAVGKQEEIPVHCTEQYCDTTATPISNRKKEWKSDILSKLHA